MRDADAADGAAGRAISTASAMACVGADALEDGVDAEAAGELADALDGLLAALGDDVGGAELARERDAVRRGGP